MDAGARRPLKRLTLSCNRLRNRTQPAVPSPPQGLRAREGEGLASRSTIRDVAREAKVSIASVSRAMNGHASVTPQTRERVRAVADRLGYVPHAGARSLSLSRTHVIGVVLPDLHGEFFSELVRGMDRATTERGYQMLFSTAHADPELARQAIRSMHGRVDGLILMAPQLASDQLAGLMVGATPTVLLNSPAAEGCDALRVDNGAGAAAMARHLLEAGRRRIVHISGPAGNIDGRERRDAFAATLRAEAPDALVRVIEGDFQEESGVRAVERLLAEGVRFDAVFAANDGMALGALSTLKAAGLRVPQDVALAGFDDVPLARFLGLTTLRVPLNELGGGAVDRLCRRLDGEAFAPEEVRLTPELVVRDSTGATE